MIKNIPKCSILAIIGYKASLKIFKEIRSSIIYFRLFLLTQCALETGDWKLK